MIYGAEIYERVSKNVSIERVHPEGRGLSYDIANRISSYHYDGVYLVKESIRMRICSRTY